MKPRLLAVDAFGLCRFCVSTVGLDAARIREYIQQQEKLETGQNRFGFE